MSSGRQPSVITDDDIAEILLSAESNVEIARRLGIANQRVSVIRRRECKHALRVAQRLGLIRPRARRCWGPDGAEQMAPDYVVRVKAGVCRSGPILQRRGLTHEPR